MGLEGQGSSVKEEQSGNMENEFCVLLERCVGWTGGGGEGGLAGVGEVRVERKGLWSRRCLQEPKILLLQAQKEQRRTLNSLIHLDSMLGQDVRSPAQACNDGVDVHYGFVCGQSVV